MSNKSKSLAQLEKSLTALEALVEKLETGDLPLEKALAEFERGIKLTRQCQAALQAAEQRIEILLSQSETAEPVSFEDDEEDEEDGEDAAGRA